MKKYQNVEKCMGITPILLFLSLFLYLKIDSVKKIMSHIAPVSPNSIHNSDKLSNNPKGIQALLFYTILIDYMCQCYLLCNC